MAGDGGSSTTTTTVIGGPPSSLGTSPVPKMKSLIKKIISFKDLHIHMTSASASTASLASLDVSGRGSKCPPAAITPGASANADQLLVCRNVKSKRVTLQQQRLAIILVGLREWLQYLIWHR
jgi:hypothetical protein